VHLVETSFYDVVVCGHEFGALLTAALLARRGFRVLLLGHDAHPLSVDLGGFVLARGPGCLPALDSPAVGRVLNDLSLVQVIRRRITSAKTEFEVCLDGRRFALRGDDSRLNQEIDAWWPEQAATVRAALTRLTTTAARVAQVLVAGVNLPPSGFWERREWGRIEASLPRPGTDLLAPLPMEHAFRRIVAQPALSDTGLGGADISAIGAVTLANAFAENRRGLSFVNGGEAGLWRLLLEKLETFSGERHSQASASELVWRGGRVTGVRLRPRDETLGCAAMVWAGSSRGLVSLLGERAPKKARELSERLRPAFFRYGLSMWLRAGTLTAGAPTRQFIVAGPGRTPVEDDSITLTIGAPDPRHASAAPAWAECLVPAGAPGMGAAAAGYFGALRARLRARLSAALPAFEGELLCLGSVHDGLPGEELAPSGEGQNRLSAAVRPLGPPLSAQPMPAIFANDQPAPFDALGTPHGVPGLRNVFLLGRENLPGLGLTGEFAAAWNVTRLLSQLLRAPRVARQSMLARGP
jgi:phytoene dehydrogenase-like protein